MKKLLGKLTKKRIKIGVVLLGVIAVLITGMAYLNNNNKAVKPIQSLAQAVLIKAHLEIAPEGYTEIRTPEQLEAVNDNLSGKYILMSDIDMTGVAHDIIGKTSSISGAFKGIFDGNNYKISNLHIESDNQYVGMFGYVYGGEIKNLILENVNVIGKGDTTYIGGLIGYAYTTVAIENITIQGNNSITNEFKSNSLFIGGLVGYSGLATTYSNIEVNNILIKGDVSNALYEGGIIGYIANDNTKLDNVEIKGNSILQSTENVNQNHIGGLVGYQKTSLINNSHAEIQITAKSKLSASYAYIGGIIGKLENTAHTTAYSVVNNTNVSNAYANVNITNEATGVSYIGGIIGYQAGVVSSGKTTRSSIEKIYSTGSIQIGTGQQFVGGLVGAGATSSIGNAYSTVNIEGENKNTGGAIGGIIGTTNATYLSNIYAIGKLPENVTTSNVGGLIGYNSNATIKNCYWSIESAGTSKNTYGESRLIQQMLLKSNYTGWEFDSTTWKIEEDLSLPYLINMPIPDEILAKNLKYCKYEGEGTKESPLLIDTIEKLQNMKLGLSSYYRLITDLDMTGVSYDIIGKTPSAAFTGVFDGNGYKISNLNIESDAQYVGMFGYVSGNGTIKNLKLENLTVTGKNTTQDSYIGGLIGYNTSAETIENIIIQGNNNITNELTTGSVYIGGVVGYSSGGAIYDNVEVNNINIIGNTNATLTEGGIIGHIANNTTINNVKIRGNSILQSTENVDKNIIGGLVGYQSASTISNSHAAVEIKTKSKQGAAEAYIGGLIGELYSRMSITNIINSYSNSNITNGATGVSYVGGLIGYQHGYRYYSSGSYHSYFSTIEKVYATGNIKIGAGKNYVGGLVGEAYCSIIQNAYSTVNIEGENENTDTVLGGIVGDVLGSTTIKNTYAIGNIVEDVATNKIGGIIGQNNNSGNPINSYWPSNMSGDKVNNSTFGSKLSAQEMLDINNYTDWNFDDTWAVVPGITFPYLVNLPIPEEIYYDAKLQGKGSKEEPFIITTIEELQTISAWPAYFELGNDINAIGTTDFQPIEKFIGILDGKNHSINNLTIKSDSDYVGIFKENNGTIKNIKLNDINTESSYSGDIAYIGGIVGYNRDTLKNIEINGSIKNTGSVTDLYMGQISGYNERLIEKTHSNGKLVNEGEITNGYIGGITGYNDKNVIISYNTGNIEVSNINNVKVGGIVGKSNRTIKDSYSDGNVNVIAKNANIGGIVGENSGIIKNTYSIDTIEKNVEEEKIGGIAGKNNGSVTASYWNIDNITEQSGNGKLKTLEELKQAFTYENWNFDNIWSIEENVNTPVFKDIFNNDENYYEEEEYFADDFWEWHTRTTTNDQAYNGKHIIINKGQSIDFYGYGVTSYKDYLYKYYTGAGEKTFMFKIDETKASYHTLDGAGFIFNASKKDNILSGYVLLITQNDINIYRLDNVNASQFETTESRTVQYYAGAPIASAPKNSSTIHNLIVKTSPTNVTVIDNDEEMLNVALDYSKHSGEDFGLIASYSQHNCSILTEVQFLEFTMEVKDYTIPVLKTDSQGNRLEGAKFQVKNTEGEVIREEITNSNGMFIIKGLQEGIYTLEEIEAPAKYALKNNALTFKVTNEGKVLDVNTEEEIEIKIINEALKFEVKVEDVKGNPITGSKVNLYDEEGNSVIGSNGQPIVVTTGTDGTATITDIEAGTYTFKQTQVSDDYILNDTIYTVTIEKDGTVTFKEDLDGVIVNKKYGHIEITKYKTGTITPLKDAVIEIKDAKGNGGRLTTNASGIITFKAPPGTYTYKEVIAPTGYILNDTEHSFTVADDGTVTYDSANGIIYNDRVTMKEPLTITKMKNGTDIVLSGAVIGIFDADGNEIARQTTGESGTITISGLEVGNYYYKEISAPVGYVLNNTEYHFTVNNDGTVTAGENTNFKIYNTRVTMTEEITITKYRTNTTTPLAGAKIAIFDTEGNKIKEAVTNEAGQVTFTGLEVGSYYYKEIEAPSGYVLNSAEYHFTVNNDGSVTAGENTNFKIYNTRVTMSEGLTITKYKTNTTIGLPGAKIAIFDTEGNKIKEATTGDNGTVTFTGLEVGSYYYKEIEAPAGYVLNSAEYHFTVNNDGSVTLAEGVNKVIYNARVTMTEGITITKYRKNTTTPLAGAKIAVFDVEGNKVKEAVTGENGQVTFTGLEVGSYYYKEIEAPAGYVLNSAEYHFTVNNDGTVKAGENTTFVIYDNRVTMAEKDNFTVTKYRTGTEIALSGAVIGIFDAEGNELSRQTTGESGTITISGLEVGSYYYKEISAPVGYVLNNTEYHFTVENDGTVALAEGVDKIIYNDRVTMTEGLTITKYRTNTTIGLPGATIAVFDTEGNKVAEKVTGENGTVTFTGLEVGNYYYKEISAPTGYVLNNTEYHFTVNNDGTVTLAEGVNKIIYNTRVTMSEEITITKYRTNTTIGLPGAKIAIFDAEGNKVKEAVTNEAGQVTFTGLEVGSYYYKEIEAPAGYVLNSAEYHFTVNNDGTVTAGENTNFKIYNTRVTMAEGLTITKYRTNTTIPLAGAKIAIFDAEGNKIAEQTTGENGTVTFTGLEVGNYYYKEISAPAGYVLNSTEYHFTVNNDGSVTLAEGVNKIIYNTRVTMTEEITITKYRTNTTTPLAGAKIAIFDAEGNKVKEAVTNEAGQVTFTGLEVGSYYYKEIEAPSGYVLNDAEYHFTVNNDGTVTAGENTNFKIYNTRVTMTEGLTITKYRKNTTIPLAGAKIAVFDVEGNKVKEAVTNEAGQVTFTGLEVGSYYYKEIEAPAGYILNNTEYHFKVENDGTVKAIEDTNFIIYNDRVSKDHIIITKYVKDTTSPVLGAVIGLFDVNGNKLTEQTTNEKGQVDFTMLEPGTYKYKEITAPDGYILNETTYTFTIAEDGTVTFDSSNGIIYNSKVTMKDSLIIVKYRTNTKTPVPGAVIGVFDEKGKEIARQTTKEDGTVTFTGITVGNYYYKEISAPTGYVLDSTEYHFTVKNDGTVAFAENATKVIYNDRLTVDHVIITKYEEGTKVAVTGAVIGLFDADGNEITRQTTNENGQVDFAGLEPGTYKYKEITAPDGYILNETTYTFTVAEDGTVTFDTANGIIYNKKEEEKPDIPKIYGDVTLVKYEQGTTIRVEGAIIGIYDVNGNPIKNENGNVIQFITNQYGEAKFKILPGTYQYKELKAPNGYILNETIYTFTVAEDGTVTFKENTNGIIYNKKKEEKPDIPEVYGNITIVKYEEGTKTGLKGAIIGIYDSNKKEVKITTEEDGTVSFKAKPGVYQYQELVAPDGYELNNTIHTFTVTKTGEVIFDNNTNGIIYDKKKEEKPVEPDKPDTPDKPDIPDKPDVPNKPEEPNKPVTPDTPKGNTIIPGQNTIIKEQPENMVNGRLPQTGETEGMVIITLILAVFGIYFGIKIRNKE